MSGISVNNGRLERDRSVGIYPLGSSLLVPGAVRHTEWRETLPMGTVAAAAIPIGSYVLLTVDGDAMRRGIGFVVLAMALLMFRNPRYEGPHGAPMATIAGALSGIIAGSTGLGRLIVGLYFLSSNNPPVVQRANIIIVGTSLAAINVIILTLSGVITLELLGRATVLFAPFAFTIWLGTRAFRITTGPAFRRVALGLVMAIAVSTIVA